eukprot:2226158-Pleurochrysis_carterae.AAC.2
MNSGCSAPSVVTSMSHSAPVLGVVPKSLVKCAKISPSGGRPLSDAKMMLMSVASSGVSFDDREEERVMIRSLPLFA